jgi:hypothetical protein
LAAAAGKGPEVEPHPPSPTVRDNYYASGPVKAEAMESGVGEDTERGRENREREREKERHVHRHPPYRHGTSTVQLRPLQFSLALSLSCSLPLFLSLHLFLSLRAGGLRGGTATSGNVQIPPLHTSFFSLTPSDREGERE